jgi:glucokinase
MRGLRVSRTINANIQNQINTSIIFHYIAAHDRVYRARIAEDLGISAPAVSRVIEALVADEFVVETGMVPTGRGRMVAELTINTQKGQVIAVDLIKEETRIAICDFRGRIIDHSRGSKLSESTEVERELIAGIDAILAAHDSRASHAGSDRRLKAIAVGIPAATSSALYPRISTPLYRGLEGLDISQTLEGRYGVPVYVENIVKVSALAEMNYGVAQQCSDLVFVEVSNGIGAGIIVDGHVYRGASGASGELGFTLLGTESLGYRPVNKGCLEDRASMEGMRRRAVEAAGGREGTMLRGMAGGDLRNLTPSHVCEAALKHDSVAAQIVAETVQSLSVGIINLILILNPQMVVLGGDLCKLPGLDELFLAPLREHALRSIPFTAPPISISALGENAGIMGASHLAIESLLASRFPYKLSSAPANGET